MPIEERTQEFQTGAKRSARMPRYDLIPKVATDRLANRFTGELIDEHATGGAYKYGEGDWEKGLPTSDVINHIIHHLTNYQEEFRRALTAGIHNGYVGEELMEYVQKRMISHSEHDDDLAGAMWGICVLMSQEQTKMHHDDNFKLALNKKC